MIKKFKQGHRIILMVALVVMLTKGVFALNTGEEKKTEPAALLQNCKK